MNFNPHWSLVFNGKWFFLISTKLLSLLELKAFEFICHVQRAFTTPGRFWDQFAYACTPLFAFEYDLMMRYIRESLGFTLTVSEWQKLINNESIQPRWELAVTLKFEKRQIKQFRAHCIETKVYIFSKLLNVIYQHNQFRDFSECWCKRSELQKWRFYSLWLYTETLSVRSLASV